MDNSLLLILLLLAFLVCLYYRNDENYTNSNSNIWKVGETLNIGDVKSSPKGYYKYAITKYGLEYYNINYKNFGSSVYPLLTGSLDNPNDNTTDAKIRKNHKFHKIKKDFIFTVMHHWPWKFKTFSID